MTKEEKIKEAYGRYFSRCEPDENGWTKSRPQYRKENEWFDSFKLDVREFSTFILYRPKSLQGIEDNNGWVKIESEDDLPKTVNIMYRIGMFLNDGKFYQDKNLCDHRTAIEALKWNYTHYQPVTEKFPPIY